MSPHLSFSDTNVAQFITHYVGNSSLSDPIILSDETSSLSDVETMDYLMTYFLGQFQPVDIQHFKHTIDLEMNEVYSCIKRIFENTDEFVGQSKNIAKMLYERADHPQIKSGELNVVIFEQIAWEAEIVSGIGLFKSESKNPFIRMQTQDSGYFIDHEFGFGLNTLDKACLILNTDESEGYKVLAIDKKNKADAQYWVDDFLRIVPVADEYNVTKSFLKTTKDFVTEELPSLVPSTDKIDQIDLLNKTMDYFKANESFEKEDFEKEVFQSEKLISSFRHFEENLGEVNKPQPSFYISDKAVKKQTGVYKSVLKLDKNFHVYIHGDRNMIEKGMDENGRKFYKIFYEEEK